MAKINELEVRVARSFAKLERGLVRKDSQTFGGRIKKQLKRVTFLGAAQQELLALRVTLG